MAEHVVGRGARRLQRTDVAVRKRVGCRPEDQSLIRSSKCSEAFREYKRRHIVIPNGSGEVGACDADVLSFVVTWSA